VAALVRSPPVTGRRKSPTWLVSAEEIVRERYVAPPSAGEIAGLVGVHPATLARAWRERFGCSIGDRIRVLRVEHAARLLAASTEPLAQIAVAAGFYDQSHLTNLFRQHFGVTPARYRAAHR